MAEQETWQEKMMREQANLDDLAGVPVASDEEGKKPEEASPQPSAPDGTEVNILDTLESAAKDGDEASGTEPAKPNPESAAAEDASLARIKELEAQLQRERSENGRARVLSDKLKERESELEAAKARIAELEGQPKAFDGKLGEFTEEESEMMSPELQRALSARFSELERQQKELNHSVAEADRLLAKSKRDAMQRAILTRFPNLDRLVTGDAWRAYCQEYDPVAHRRVGTLFNDAVQNFDADAAVALIERFIRVSGVSDSHVSDGAARPHETFSQPQAASAGGNAQVYKYDEVMHFLNDVYSGRKSLSDEAVFKRYQAYKAAMDEGRVEQ